MDFSNLEDIFSNLNNQNPNKEEDILKKYGRNLTDLAARNKLDPVINRDDEIRRVIRILSRKTKNNPVLVGEPGVGKTAIVEGLARKIVEGQVPENLKNKDVIELDLTALIAGASYQGQFEKRIKDVLEKIEKMQGEIILFIDEIHMLVGTGRNNQGGMDAANILKPMMARGQLHLIGATTFDEYRQYIEKDVALERRMQKVDISEPNVDDTIAILRGIKERFENFHNVKIQDDALVAAARLSSRYISDRFLPDKAIDLVDEAAATIKTEINFQPEHLEKARQKLAKLEMEKIALSNDDKHKYKTRIEEISKEINEINNEIKTLEHKWNNEKQRLEEISKLKKILSDLQHKYKLYQQETDYEKASKVLYVEIPKVEKELKRLEEELSSDSNTLIKESVTAEEIASIVSKWTKIPVTKLLEEDKNKLLNLKNELKSKIKGQDKAIDAVVQAIWRAKANINDPNHPLASFLFTGPTGVGKTELARTLAYALFDSEKNMIRVDMSEFMEKNSVSKFIGTSPGYIGFNSGIPITEKIRRNPYTILLLDEIEKANKDVLNILLQILDNGMITDGRGRVINCRNLIIIMTSNLNAQEILKGEINGEKSLSMSLSKLISAEFINRIDEVVKFNPLPLPIIKEIVQLETNKLASRIKELKNIDLLFTDKSIDFIAQSAYDEHFGARPIRRFIQDNIESVLSFGLIDGNLEENKSYTVDVFAGNFQIKNNN